MDLAPGNLPRKLFLDSPITIGRPSSANFSRRAISSDCAPTSSEPMPGSTAMVSRPDRGPPDRGCAMQGIRQRRHNLFIARVFLHGSRLALHVHEDDPAPNFCATAAMAGSWVSAETSLMIWAPRPRLFCYGRLAGIDRNQPVDPSGKCRTIGMTRANSSSVDTGAAPGAWIPANVDDGRTASTMRSACSTADRRARNGPHRKRNPG